MSPSHKTTAFTDLAGCELPIQLAPMAGPVGVELAIAVAEAGGHAVYPTVLEPPGAAAAALERIAVHTRAFGANFIVPLLDPDVLEVAIERAPLIDFYYADPDPGLVARVHEGGALASWQVGSVAEAIAAGDAGCDLVVAQGSEAGGRIRGELTLAELLPQVVEAVDVPVIATGGIATAADVSAALMVGAAGVRIGTRFIAAAESAAHPAWVEAIVDAEADEAVITRAFSVGVPDFPHRVLRRSIEAAERCDDECVGEMEIGGLVRQIRRFESPAPTASFSGTVEAMPFYAGRSAGAVDKVLPAAAIVAELARVVPQATTEAAGRAIHG